MGRKTATDIIAEGMQKASRDDLQLIALKWLNTWLEKQYASWSWPFLYEKLTVALNSGATSVRVGGGNGGETRAIRRILDPIKIRTSNFSVRQLARIRSLIDPLYNSDQDEFFNPTTAQGIPELFTVESGANLGQTAAIQSGIWDLVPNVIPDRNLQLQVQYLVQPEPLSLTQYPVYPSDETMIQHVYARCLRDGAGNDAEQVSVAQQQDEITAGMAINDRLVYGTVDGTNDNVGLDKAVFR